MKSFIFPSALEKHNEELKNIFTNLINGIKIRYDGNGFIVGDLAMIEGTSPHKIVNSSPNDVDYKVLGLASLLLAGNELKSPITLTVGFPYSTYLANRELAAEFFQGVHEIEYDTFSIGKNSTRKLRVEIESVDVIPEIVGASFAVRHNRKIDDNCFVVNLGYGTFEGCLTNQYGIIDRTVISAQGIRYAIEDAMKELNKKYYLGLRNETQFDVSFQKGSLVVNRRKQDILAQRKSSIEKYYNDIISPAIRNIWQDDDFANTSNLFLAGGGSYYPELVELFESEFSDFLNVEVVENPHTAVSRGYCLRSSKLTDNPENSIGLDIGNAQTVLTFFNE